MSEMVERVAAALCRAHGFYSWDCDFDEDAEARGDATKDTYREWACAAIAAMREPTDEMKYKGAEHIDYDEYGSDADAFHRCVCGTIYEVMIETALK